MSERRVAALALVALAISCTDNGAPAAAGPAMTLAFENAGNPTAAIDPRTGTRYVAWVETRAGSADVYLTVDPGPDGSEPIRVNDIRGDAAPHDQAPAQVAVGPEGNVYVVWQNNTVVPGRRFPASNVRFARSMDGGRTFEPAIFVNDDAEDAPTSHTFHDIAVAGDGTIYVSWIDGRARTRAEAGRTATAAGNMDMDHALHGPHAAPDGAAVNPHDAVPGSEVRVARSDDNGRSFGANVIAAAGVCPCCRTAIVADAAGSVFVAYRSATDNIRNIVVSHSTDAARSFGEPVTVHDDGWQIDGCPHAGPSLVLDAHGRLHAAWYTGAGDRQGVWYAVAAGDGTFTTPQPVLTGAWVPVSQVKLAADRNGGVWVAWDDRREEPSSVQIARVGRRGIGAPTRVMAGEHPALAAGADVILAWGRRDGSAHVLQLLAR
jgi:hypothetical protein